MGDFTSLTLLGEQTFHAVFAMLPVHFLACARAIQLFAAAIAFQESIVVFYMALFAKLSK